MSKYSTELKLDVVNYYLKEHSGYTLTAEKFDIPRSLVVRWVRKYKENGYEGLIKNQKISYDGNFKQNVVEYMYNNHLSCQETAFHFNLAGDYVVSKWERIYYEEGPQGLYIERRGRSRNMSSKSKKKNLNKEIEEDLIAENQRLRMENEYLKKLNALVQERIKQENKKK